MEAFGFDSGFLWVVGLACAGGALLFLMVLVLRALLHLDEVVPSSTLEDWKPEPHEARTSASIRELAESGRKIEAIKRMREESGLSLAEAKDAVEALIAGKEPGLAPDADSTVLDKPGPAQREVTELNDDDRRIVEDLLAQDRKIEAIKWYREHTNQGLAEAKDAVEQIQRDLDEFGPL